MKTYFMKTQCGRPPVTAVKFSTPNGQPSRSMRHAFTLMELLVVIAIIGVLAALTIPGMRMAKAASIKNVVRGELNQIQTALENYKAKYGTYPPGNQNTNSLYAPANDRSQFSQLYYELVGTVAKLDSNGKVINFMTLDNAFSILPADVNKAYGVGGFINSTKGNGDNREDVVSAKNFLPGIKQKQTYYAVTNNGVPTTILVTAVGGPDDTYKPLNAVGLNPFCYVYPGVKNPNSYDLWVDLCIYSKTNRLSNWSKQAQILK